jgi:hypothetical protein
MPLKLIKILCGYFFITRGEGRRRANCPATDDNEALWKINHKDVSVLGAYDYKYLAKTIDFFPNPSVIIFLTKFPLCVVVLFSSSEILAQKAKIICVRKEV